MLDEGEPASLPTTIPDLREEDAPLKVQSGDFVIVPIPISNPTFDTGLILGAAYFYGQTEEQKKVQPASLTGGSGAYTSNESFAVAAVQEDRPRQPGESRAAWFSPRSRGALATATGMAVSSPGT